MDWKKDSKELRVAYSDLLIEYANKDDRICIVESDLMGAASTVRFRTAHPDKTVDCGVAEADMIGVAAGMSAMGLIPFTHTFAPFATRRCCDQVTLSVAYAGLNVKMVGSDPGVSAELNGGTHMSFEDIAIMRNIPGMTVVEPVDQYQLEQLFPQIVAHDGPVYIRLFRKPAYTVYHEGDKIELGRGNVLKSGMDVSIIATGIMVKEAIDAAEALEAMGIRAEVVNIHTIKPLDEALVLKTAAKTGCVVTAENAFDINGLGSAVSDCLSSNAPCPVVRVGVHDRFGEVGMMDYLQKTMHLTADDIAAAAKKAVSMKK